MYSIFFVGSKFKRCEWLDEVQGFQFRSEFKNKLLKEEQKKNAGLLSTADFIEGQIE